jgi:hypothetical protein
MKGTFICEWCGLTTPDFMMCRYDYLPYEDEVSALVCDDCFEGDE